MKQSTKHFEKQNNFQKLNQNVKKRNTIRLVKVGTVEHC